MAFDPSLSSSRDHLRLLLGDVATSDSKVDFPDATYDAKISASGYVQAALELCLGLIAVYGRKVTDAKDGDGAQAYKDRIVALKQVADDVRAGNVQEPGTNRPGIAISAMKAGNCFEPEKGYRC